MKKLGLIGGIGPESTLAYYRDIVFGVQKRGGNLFFPNLCIESLDVFQILEFCGRADYEGLTDYVGDGIDNLVKAGAEFVAMTGNTPHIVYEKLAQRTKVPIVSIVESSCQEAVRRKYKKIVLLGTGITMQSDFFQKPFLREGIQVVSPSEEVIRYLADKISGELELGIVKEDTRKGIRQIVCRMEAEEQIDAVALGCTELPLIFDGMDSPVPVLDTMRIHIDDLIRMIMEEHVE